MRRRHLRPGRVFSAPPRNAETGTQMVCAGVTFGPAGVSRTSPSRPLGELDLIGSPGLGLFGSFPFDPLALISCHPSVFKWERAPAFPSRGPELPSESIRLPFLPGEAKLCWKCWSGYRRFSVCGFISGAPLWRSRPDTPSIFMGSAVDYC